jgi:anthranilate synthase/aminodeoxychorismate synthase-like glutamine amidotransferase
MTGVVIIDNFDSFVYNLYQYVGEQGVEVRVLRNNVSLTEIESQNPERLIISPGPGRPEDTGVSIEAIERFSGKIPILGVCLGHQAIGAAFGAEIIRAERLLHLSRLEKPFYRNKVSFAHNRF